MNSHKGDFKLSPFRPCTSEGRYLTSLPPIKSQQPPRHLLPPYPPPCFASMKLTPLPELKNSRKSSVKRTRYRHQSQGSRLTLPKVQKSASTDTLELQENAKYICRLCGFSCISGDFLHAHLLLLQHNFLQSSQTRFTCRQCGVSWFLDDEERSNSHPCLLQKAAYFRNVMASAKHVKEGLPFTCLFCCSEPEIEVKDRPHIRRQSRRPVKKKSVPLKPWCASARFSSKLELSVHIRYIHAPSRLSGRCPECPEFETEENEAAEIDFWEETSQKGLRPKSADSIINQEGLGALEDHIENTHMDVYKYLEWINLKQNRSGPQELSEKSKRFQTSWMYACPFCQINPMPDEVSNKEGPSIIHPQIGLPSNAALQAHIACFHAAGTSFIDRTFHACSVCGDFNTSPSLQYKHLQKEGHTARLKQNFSKALRQGRFACLDGKEDIEWRNTCVVCWRRFGGIKVTLRDECRLQAHLLSTHCICKRENWDHAPLSCGWCGDTRQKSEQKSKGSSNRELSELRGLERLKARQKRNKEDLFADFQWSIRHETNHAEAIFRWWKSNSGRKRDVNSITRRGLLWSRGSWRDS